MNQSILLSFLFAIDATAFLQCATHHRQSLLLPPSSSPRQPPHQHQQAADAFTFTRATSITTSPPLTPLHARPKSKWDDLVDEDEEDDIIENTNTNYDATASGNTNAQPDTIYTEANIRRQADAYDQLESIGGKDLINDVYARAPGEKEWWLVGKVARISDISPEQAIYRQWPLVERHIWALRLPVRPTSSGNIGTPFEIWYAPGHSELDAARNDPNIPFVKVSNIIQYNDGVDVPAAFVGFVGKTYDVHHVQQRSGEDPMFFVERNVGDGSCLRGKEIEGDWILKSELDA